MRHDLLPRLVCPACRCGLHPQVWQADALRILSGYLQCPTCAIVTPVVEGFVLFTEPCLHPGQATPAALARLADRLFGSAADFQRLLRERRARGGCEVYAAFQPFNEAMRVIEPLLPWLRPRVPARGGAILDLWCRSGWSAQWLAGCFPDTPVVAMWEGAHSVLGYKGWRHLMGPGQRRDNLDVVFSDPRRPLPFAEAAFSLVYSHDLLHRHGWQPLAGESLRVADPDGAVLHTHLHLSNSEPEPFFQRGCQQEHGRDWRAWLDGVEAASRTAGRPRRGWVLGESTLFSAAAPIPLDDAPDTPDYNGLLLVLPADAAADDPADTAWPWTAGWRQLPNPLLRLSAAACEARVHAAALGGGVPGLLRQHPVWAVRLPARGLRLDATDWALLALCAAGVDGGMLRECVDDADGAARRFARFHRHEVLHAAPVDRTTLHLQAVHALLADRLEVSDGSPEACRMRIAQWLDGWSAAAGRTVLALADGDGLDGAGARLVFDAVQRWLAGAAAEPGCLRLTGQHPLGDLLGLAAALAGWSVHWQPEESAAGVQLLIAGDRAAPPAWRPLGADGEADGLLAALLAAMPESDSAPGAPRIVLDAMVALPAAGLRAPLHLWLTGTLLLEPWRLAGEPDETGPLPGWLLRWGRWQAEALTG